MNSARGTAAQLAVVLLVALAVRLLFAVWWQTDRLEPDEKFAFPDSESYWELGTDIATGRPYEFQTSERQIFRSPGYPLLLAGLFRILGESTSPLVARALGAILGTLTIGIVSWLALRLFNPQVAIGAAAIVTVYPGAIVTSGLILAEAPFCLWMVLQLFLWQLAVSRWNSSPDKICGYNIAAAGAAGVAAGLATLTRPSWILFMPLAAAASCLLCRPRKTHVAVGGLMLAGFVVTMVPWWIRNYQVTGRFVPTTLQVGASLYDGLNPTADGSSDMRFVSRFEAEQRQDDVQHVAQPGGDTIDRSTFEYRLDRRMHAAASSWALQHPTQAIRLAAVKFSRFWNVWPNEASLRSWPVRLVILITYLPVMWLALQGAWQHRRERFTLLLLLLPAVYFSLLHTVFVGSLRYRQPAMLLLSILAAAAIIAWNDSKQVRHSTSSHGV